MLWDNWLTRVNVVLHMIRSDRSGRHATEALRRFGVAPDEEGGPALEEAWKYSFIGKLSYLVL